MSQFNIMNSTSIIRL